MEKFSAAQRDSVILQHSKFTTIIHLHLLTAITACTGSHLNRQTCCHALQSPAPVQKYMHKYTAKATDANKYSTLHTEPSVMTTQNCGRRAEKRQ